MKPAAPVTKIRLSLGDFIIFLSPLQRSNNYCGPTKGREEREPSTAIRKQRPSYFLRAGMGW
jgi:hypothetical protein